MRTPRSLSRISLLDPARIAEGVGIAIEEQALVFEEFRQASGDYLRKSEGTGLGLSLSKRFVELHGGDVKMKSTPGTGTSVICHLPETAAPRAPRIELELAPEAAAAR